MTGPIYTTDKHLDLWVWPLGATSIYWHVCKGSDRLLWECVPLTWQFYEGRWKESGFSAQQFLQHDIWPNGADGKWKSLLDRVCTVVQRSHSSCHAVTRVLELQHTYELNNLLVMCLGQPCIHWELSSSMYKTLPAGISRTSCLYALCSGIMHLRTAKVNQLGKGSDCTCILEPRSRCVFN